VPPAIGTPLPDAEHAVISQKKLEDYVLSVQHPVGRNKARVFLATLGIESTDWNYLRDAILAGLTAAPITAV
jgi:hypothetical protein